MARDKRHASVVAARKSPRQPDGTQLPVWARESALGGYALTIHVQPDARRSALAGLHGDALKIRIAAPPTDNQANEALLEYLRVRLAVSRSQLEIAHGKSARRKVVVVRGELDALTLRIHELGPRPYEHDT